MLSSVPGRSRPIFLFATLFGLLTLVYLLFSPSFHGSTGKQKLAQISSSYFKGTDSEFKENEELVDDGNAAWTIPYSTSTPQDLAIANSTLGFQKIYVLGLPDRLLKRDSVELGASITNLNLTWMDGVLGMDLHFLFEGQIASTRGVES